MQMILRFVNVAGWPSFGTVLFTWLSVPSLGDPSVSQFDYFQFWFREKNLGSSNASPWSQLIIMPPTLKK